MTNNEKVEVIKREAKKMEERAKSREKFLEKNYRSQTLNKNNLKMNESDFIKNSDDISDMYFSSIYAKLKVLENIW